MSVCLHLNLQKVRSQAKFDIGDVEIAESAFMNFTGHDIYTSLLRHATGDWGDTLPGGCISNDQEIVNGGLIASYYTFPNDELVIITSMYRRLTTVARCF